jgi:opacity protein-like surface antigen
MFNDSETEFGYDLTLGVDLNFFNKICAEGGVRYMKTFGLAQQLGGEAVDISPEYFQFYLGVGIAFQWVMEWDADEEEGEGQEGGVEE